MRQRQQRAAAKVGPQADKIVRELKRLHSRSGHSLARIWDDWICSIAAATSNGCDKRPAVYDRREAEYMDVVARHGREAMHSFKAMFGLLLEALDVPRPVDVLGSIYMALELGSDSAGQFFTPTDVCELMAAMLMTPEQVREQVERDGWLSICEPAIGGGATVIPVIAAVREAGLDPTQHMHVTGVDVHGVVLRMAYVQLSWLGVPAVLSVGDSLRMEFRDDWYTPAHIAFGWGPRLRGEGRLGIMRAITDAAEAVDEVLVEQRRSQLELFAE